MSVKPIGMIVLCGFLALAMPAAKALAGGGPYLTEVVSGYLATAPNGNQLWVKIIQPREDLYPGESFPGVVQVSGGLGAGENGNLHLADDGFVEFHFNAEGRGVLFISEGEEDHNGFIHQDDLKAVIEFALTRPNVEPDNLGVITGSYGITMGTGCLGRYPELPVKYLVDVEGPSDSFVISKEPWSLDEDPSNDMVDFTYKMFGHWSLYRDPSPENEAWWAEREAVRFIGSISCRYLRMQAEWDHAQPPNALWPGFDYPPLWYQNKLADDLVNLAVTGDSPWVRVNGVPLGNLPNQTYSRENPPTWYSGAMNSHPGEQELVIMEMAAMPPLTVAAGLTCTPTMGTLPFPATFSVTLTNRYQGQTRRLAGRVNALLASGNTIPGWRAGYTNVSAGGSYTSTWGQTIPALGSLVGDNIFVLLVDDVTPAPYNQPPYPAAGDMAADSCTVTGVAP